MGDTLPYEVGKRLKVEIRQVQFRDGGSDEYHPDWVVASGGGGLMYLLYGVKHEIIPQPQMRAIMEFREPGRWVLIQNLPPIQEVHHG